MDRGAGSRTAFFDEKSADAVLYRKLEAAFPGQEVFITSRTDDGALALVEVAGNRNPGDFYVFDTKAGKAAYLRSEEHTSELQSLMRSTYAVFCLKKKNNKHTD